MFQEQLLNLLMGIIGVSCIPVFFIFLDYHKRSNIHKAVLFVVALFAVIVIVALIPPLHLLVVAFCVPFLLIAYLAIARRR